MFDNLDQLLDVQTVRSDLAMALKEARGEKYGDKRGDDGHVRDGNDDECIEEEGSRLTV